MSKGFFILCGPPGGGKSFEAAHAFPQSLYIKSSPNVLQFYEQWLVSPPGIASGLALPATTVTVDVFSINEAAPQVDTAGNLIRIPQYQTLTGMLVALVQECTINRGQNLGPSYGGVPIRNVVIDEGSTFWQRIFSEIKPLCFANSGNPDTRKAFGETAEWSVMITDQLRLLPTLGVNVCFVTHDQEPEIAAGKKGGPKVVSQGIMRTMTADADGVLLRVLERPPPEAALGTKPMRKWRAHSSPDWITKLRGVSDEQFEMMADMNLSQILALAGYAA